jgi:hypothetical protein
VRISQSIERNEPPVAKLLILAAALCISLVLGASSARAQADTTITPTNITIFSNLGPSSTDLFFTGESTVALNGGCILGAQHPFPSCEGEHAVETWLAMPFTPKQNSHATELQAAVGVFNGTNQFQLALFNDNNGTPGTALVTVTVTDAPPSNTCCKLATANLGTPGVALTAGKKYWVVAKTDDVDAPDFSGIWAFSNDGKVATGAPQNGKPVFTTEENAGGFAFAVRGTTP